MDHILWEKIKNFPLQETQAEFGFNTRLAHENKWTFTFTQNALVEYKRFMYLAATSNKMVSPSPIVDEVWHLHLIYTQSYQEFCSILGKTIEHIPSTHNKEERLKFADAVAFTKNVYEQNFGPMPAQFWSYEKASDILQLSNAKKKSYLIYLVSSLVLIALLILGKPLFLLVYPKIGGAVFLWSFIVLSATVFCLLEWYNRSKINAFITSLHEPSLSFLKGFVPEEMAFIKTENWASVFHGMMNNLIRTRAVKIGVKYELSIATRSANETIFEKTLLDELDQFEKPTYLPLLHRLKSKPLFLQYTHAGNMLAEQFTKSQLYFTMLAANVVSIAFLFLIGFSRLETGILRDKPVAFLVIMLVVLGVVSFAFLNRLSSMFTKFGVCKLYKEMLEQVHQNSHDNQSSDWSFFLYGTAMFATPFVPLVTHSDNRSATYDGTSASSCGSSCGGGGGGGGCGGGCGGCGS